MTTQRTLGPGQPAPPPWPDAPEGWRWCRKGSPCQLEGPDGWRTANYNYPERALAEAQRRILSTPKPKEQPKEQPIARARCAVPGCDQPGVGSRELAPQGRLFWFCAQHAPQIGKLRSCGWSFVPTGTEGWLRLHHADLDYTRNEPDLAAALQAAIGLQANFERRDALRRQREDLMTQQAYSIDQAASALRGAGYTVRPHGARYLVASQGGAPTPLTGQELITMAAAQAWITGESPLSWTAVCGQCGQSFISATPVADGALCPSCVGTVASDAPAPAAPHTLPLIELLPALEAHARRLPVPLPRDYAIPLPTGLPALLDVPIDLVATSRYQPRTTFDEGELDELAASIQQHGIQTRPIVFANEHGKLELVAGERRLRAARKLGMAFIPVDVRSYSLQTAFELAGVDNIQRAGLTSWEEGAYFNRLISELQISENELSKRLGKNRAYIQQRRAVASGAPGLIQALAEEQITFSVARGIALAAPGDHKAQQAALKQMQAWAKNGRNVSEAEARAETEKLIRKRLEADLKSLSWHISGAGEIWAPSERPRIWTGAEMLEAVKAQRRPTGTAPEGAAQAADLHALQWQHDQISHACAPWIGVRKHYNCPWVYLAPNEVPALAEQIRDDLAAIQARVQPYGFTIDPGTSTYTRIEVKGSRIREVVYSWTSLEDCVKRIEAGDLVDRPPEQQHASVPARQSTGMKCGGCGKKTDEGLMWLGGKSLCTACRAPVLAQQKAEREAAQAAKAAAEAQIRQRVDAAIGAWLRAAPAGALPLIAAAMSDEPVEDDWSIDAMLDMVSSYIRERFDDEEPIEEYAPAVAKLLAGMDAPAPASPIEPLILGDLPEDSPLAPIQQGVFNINAWLGLSGAHAADEEIAANLVELRTLGNDLDAYSDSPDISDEQFELLSHAIGELTRMIGELREQKAVAA